MQPSWNMAPYMVETAFHYSRAARSLWGIESGISLVNAAISIEILLKSYNSKITGNVSAVNQKYHFNTNCLNENRHNLVHLFNALPSDAREKLEEPYMLELLIKYQNTFVSERYVYELNTRGGGSSSLIDISEDLVRKTVAIYKELGCDDSWVVSYPNV